MGKENEIEVKILYEDPERIKEAILSLGATDLGVELQTNYRLDSKVHPVNPEDHLRIRVTEKNGRIERYLTYKERIEDAKVRHFIEHTSEISDEKSVLDLLARLGYTAQIMKKRRHSYRLRDFRLDFDQWDETILAMPYIEIEGPDIKSIYDLCSRLGIQKENISTRSVRELIEEETLTRTGADHIIT